MTNFTGTQAQLADELERSALSIESVLEVHPTWKRFSRAYRKAAALVRTAIITEEVKS